MTRKVLITPSDIGKRVTKAQILVVADGTFLPGKDSKDIRRNANYEDHIPRCSSCIHRVFAVRTDADTGYVRTTVGCSKLNIKTIGNACCDHWTSSAGEVLE